MYFRGIMQTSQVNCSPDIFSVLSRYPKWLEMIIEAIDKPLIDKNYCPEVIEVFDQYGLLVGRIHGCLSYECNRNAEEPSSFIAWLLDGELAVFYVGYEIVINRLQILSEVGGF
jgi:hypothetical protein